MNETPRPVIFSRPRGWDQLTSEEKFEYASRIADAMGFKRIADAADFIDNQPPDHGGEYLSSQARGTITCSGLGHPDLEIEEVEHVVDQGDRQ